MMTLNPQLPQTTSDISGLRDGRPVALSRLKAGIVDEAMSRAGPGFPRGLVASSTTMPPKSNLDKSLVWSGQPERLKIENN